MKKVTVKAYAKINLALNVFEKNADGYHELDMVMVPVALHDDIVIEEISGKTYITCDNQKLECDESNLVYKAYKAIKEKYKINANYHFDIHKRIPMSAGLGGGSADCGSVLTTLLAMNNIEFKDEEIIEMARKLGGDVAFDLFYRPARCRGIGEKLEFFNIKNTYYVLLCKPSKGVNTGLSYKKFDEIGDKNVLSNIDELIKGLENGNEPLVTKNLKNSLQKGSCELLPEIKEIIDEFVDCGISKVMMSGSGSTVFALSKHKEKLESIAEKMAKNDRIVILTKTISL